MRLLRTLIFFISCVLLIPYSVFAQEAKKDNTEEVVNTTAQDSIIYKQRYGLRLGGDVSKLVRSFLDDDYSGFEINGDYRLTKRWFLAGEIGFEERTLGNDFINTTSNGTYFKAGADFNMYKNWLGMENMIYSGFRVGVSTFTQTLNNFTVFTTDQFWNPQFSSNDAVETDGLNAIWAELIIGIKAEIFHNLYIGLNAQIKSLVSEKAPDNLENLYIPGFARTYDSGNFGFSYGYNISYLIPLYKKAK